MWTSTIATIQKRGLSQAQIAAACNCGQVTISDLARGKTKQPHFALGLALTKLVQASDAELEAIRRVAPVSIKAAV